MKATFIDWDVDDIDVIEELGLPDEVEIPDEVASSEEYDAVADYLSDAYGFCVNSFALR